MRINKASEAILAKYIQEPSSKRISSFGSYKPKAKGSTLEEFYREVKARSALQIEHVYTGKNATEIESMMNQNRRLIEAQRKTKK
ncbi:hypothetical protein [Sulfuricurvum sp.]|uniref:hypothetical protein n=1 Tax=Sulfuricurvum sp. TaxID=2025608 RepID=UPI002616471A|nr:hypothetical protein [Sulfuricurvum sp.]MDD2779977.1 hypothetical protein [Sulfuricurvum sp.]